MKLRYLLLPLALFPMASLFGVNASANAAATPAANAAATPEADTKASSAAADVKATLSESHSSPHSTAIVLDLDNAANSALARDSFVQWVNAHRCPPTCKTKKVGWVEGWYLGAEGKKTHQTMYSHVIRYEGDLCGTGSLAGEHCDDQCVADLCAQRSCPHMNRLALKCFKTHHARIENGCQSVFVDCPSHYSLRGYKPYALPTVTASLIEFMPKELIALVVGYIREDRLIHIRLRDAVPHPVTKNDSIHDCTYALDADSISVDRTIYNCLRCYIDRLPEMYVSETPIAPINIRGSTR